MSPSTLLRGGLVRTPGGVTDAVLVVEGHVAAVGGRAVDAAPADVTLVDLDGDTLLPGFGDGHIHPLWGGYELAQAPVRDCTSVAEVVEAVRRYAAENPGIEWVQGGSYDPTLAPGGLFDARWLDDAVADRPVVLVASDHHCSWVNSEALRRAGITRDTPDPEASAIPRRDDGEVLGTLVEWGAMHLVERLIPARAPSAHLTSLRDATAVLASQGVTWVQEAAASPADLDRYLDAARHGALRVRVDVALRAEPGSWSEALPRFTQARERARAFADGPQGRDAAGDPWVTVSTVKFFSDGVIEAGTAALLSPYADAPHSCGLPVWPADQLADAVAAVDALGFDAHIHAIGDAGIRQALDAHEQAALRNGPRDRRGVIAHTQLVDAVDLPRFAALGVVANVEPLWACLDPGMTELTMPRLGAERSGRQYPMRSLVDSGAPVSFGSDWPVSSSAPLEGLAVAITRRTPEGHPPEGWLPQERLSPAQALAAYTSGTAYQAGEESRWGSIAPGMRADLVRIRGDLLASEPLGWPSLAVVATYLAGEPTWTAGVSA